MEGEAEITTEGAATAAAIGVFLGALLATFLLSRLFLWLLRGRVGGWARIVLANLLSIAIIFVIVGFTRGEGGFDPGAVVPYLLPQTIWLAIDVFRNAARLRAKG